MGSRADPSADGSTAASPWTDAPRAASCALVYSDVRHVPTINQILEDVEEVLFKYGLAARRLGDEIRSGQGYPESLRKLLSDCVLGVVVLDGLRPNVTYELGFLLGLSKPVIVLQSASAVVSVKTLYDDHGGLQKKQFDDAFQNPYLRQDHFSDFDRAHVGFFDTTARRGEPKHLKTLLGVEIGRRRNEIISETTRSQTTGSPQAAVNALSGPVADLAQLYYAKPEDVDVSALRQAWEAVRTRSEQHGIRVPPATTLVAAATWMSKAETLFSRPDDRRSALTAALELYEQALGDLSQDANPERWAEAQFGVGWATRELSLWGDRATRIRKAIAAFEQALKVRTLESFPIDFALTQHHLGLAFWSLAVVEDKVQNCKRAIVAFEQALKVRTRERLPREFASTQTSLGIAFRVIAEIENKAENCRKAIAAQEQALKVLTRERYPKDFAAAQNNLGNAFCTLAEVEDKAENCRKGLAAYEQALKVRTLDRFPREFAMTQNNLGNAFHALAGVEDKAGNCKKAINAFEQALKVLTRERFPFDFAWTQRNLGKAFHTLAGVEDKTRNCGKAIAALEESARLLAQHDVPGLLAAATEDLAQARASCGDTGDGGREPQA